MVKSSQWPRQNPFMVSVLNVHGLNKVSGKALGEGEGVTSE